MNASLLPADHRGPGPISGSSGHKITARAAAARITVPSSPARVSAAPYSGQDAQSHRAVRRQRVHPEVAVPPPRRPPAAAMLHDQAPGIVIPVRPPVTAGGRAAAAVGV